MTRPLLAKIWLVLAGLVIFLAVALSVVRVLLPYVDRYHEEVERWMSGALGQPVEVGAVEARWHGLGPRLTMSEVHVLDGPAGRTLVRVGRVEVAVNLLDSAIHRAPRIERLMVSDVRLSVVRGRDGAVSIVGVDVVPEARDLSGRRGGKRLLAWMLSQRRVALADAEIAWADHSAEGGRQLRFSEVNVEMRNAGRRHQLEGSAMLPALFGRRLSFAVDLRGDLLDSRRWEGQAYVNGGGLRLGEWAGGVQAAGLRLTGGTAEVTAWARWAGGRLQHLDGDFSAFELELAGKADPGSAQAGEAAGAQFAADALSGRFAWRRREEGWRLDINELVLDRQGRLWPSSDVGVLVERDDAGSVVTANIDYLDLTDTAELLRASDLVPASVHGLLAGLRPRGAVKGTQVRVARRKNGASYALRTAVVDLSTMPHGRVPGVTGFDGSLYLDDRGGTVDLDARAAGLRFGELFREALPVDELRGVVRWDRARDGGWKIRTPGLAVANRDLSLTARGALELPAAGSAGPAVDLVADFEAPTGDNVSRYLPAAVIPPKALQWLDRSIIAGRVPEGRLVLRGPLRKFPFDRGAGLFKVDFAVRGGVLDYAPGWPRIGDIDAQVVFEGRRMTIRADGGQSLSSRVGDVEVRIGDLAAKPALLEIDGKARGPTGDALRFLRETPLAGKFGGYMEGATAQGDSRLDLRLAVPLEKGRPIEIDGRLGFQDSALSLADGKIDVTAIDGELGFTDDGLSARGIRAAILDLPAEIDVRTGTEDGERVTRIEAGGSAAAGEIAGLLELGVLKGHLDGQTQWRAGLRIPGARANGEQTADLWITSGLGGLAVNLPPPLAKTPAQTMTLHLQTVLPRSLDRPVHVSLGESLRAVLDVDDGMDLERGEVRLGGDAARMPEERGLRISGAVDELDYSRWNALLPGGGDGGRGVVSAVALEIGELDFHGRPVHEARVSARRGERAWLADIESREITGRVEIPHADQLPWRLDLEALHLSTSGTRERGHPDPRELPPLQVDSERFTYNDIDFGSLSLTATRRPSGLHFERIALSSEPASITARGDWVVTSQSQYSSFVIGFDTEDFGDALSRFGYADTIRKGKAHFDITARWRGPPTEFGLERLDGSVHILITDGRLLDVDPGPGRIFGLISLQALPRRLTLDFSDVFRKGFTFDRIEGSFMISDGVAQTSDLSMDGPAASMTADGRIDLADGTYDQVVVVTPNVSSGLPVAGAVAGGVGVGAAILLMEKLFKPDIERLTRITYRVTGNWNEPRIERVQPGGAPGAQGEE